MKRFLTITYKSPLNCSVRCAVCGMRLAACITHMFQRLVVPASGDRTNYGILLCWDSGNKIYEIWGSHMEAMLVKILFCDMTTCHRQEVAGTWKDENAFIFREWLQSFETLGTTHIEHSIISQKIWISGTETGWWNWEMNPASRVWDSLCQRGLGR